MSNSSIKTPFDTIPNFAANPTVSSIKSGSSSDPNTWSTGRVPSDGDIVSIAGGTVVSYDVVSTAHLDAIGIQAGGELDFRNDVNTEVIVANFMVLPGGTLQIGTTSAPIMPNVTANVIFANKPLDLTIDPMQYGDGLIALGKVTMAGAEKTSFMELAVEPKVGDTTLTLAQPVTGWQVGDRLYLPDTRQLQWNERDSNYVSQNEHPIIAAISPDGKTVTLASPLQYNHIGARDGEGVLDYLPHVANLTRNVVFESEDPNGTRGHVMFTYRADVDVRYVGFTDLGRTLESGA